MNIEEVREFVEVITPLVGNVTDSAVSIAWLYVAFNLLVELLIPLSGIAALYKIAVMIKEWAITKKVVIQEVEVSLDKQVVSRESAHHDLHKAFAIAREAHKGLWKSEFIGDIHAKWIAEACAEKLSREG